MMFIKCFFFSTTMMMICCCCFENGVSLKQNKKLFRNFKIRRFRQKYIISMQHASMFVRALTHHNRIMYVRIQKDKDKTWQNMVQHQYYKEKHAFFILSIECKLIIGLLIIFRIDNSLSFYLSFLALQILQPDFFFFVLIRTSFFFISIIISWKRKILMG